MDITSGFFVHENDGTNKEVLYICMIGAKFVYMIFLVIPKDKEEFTSLEIYQGRDCIDQGKFPFGVGLGAMVAFVNKVGGDFNEIPFDEKFSEVLMDVIFDDVNIKNIPDFCLSEGSDQSSIEEIKQFLENKKSISAGCRPK